VRRGEAAWLPDAAAKLKNIADPALHQDQFSQ
jgi:hypothetical protein